MLFVHLKRVSSPNDYLDVHFYWFDWNLFIMFTILKNILERYFKCTHMFSKVSRTFSNKYDARVSYKTFEKLKSFRSKSISKIAQVFKRSCKQIQR